MADFCFVPARRTFRCRCIRCFGIPRFSVVRFGIVRLVHRCNRDAGTADVGVDASSNVGVAGRENFSVGEPLGEVESLNEDEEGEKEDDDAVSGEDEELQQHPPL